MKNRLAINSALGAVIALLGAGCVVLGLLYGAERKERRALQAQMTELGKKEQRAAIVQSVSRQMEEIAYQQKSISDEQREEAEQQTRVANDERQKAQASERQAKASEQRARASERQAQDARQQAEQQRLQAEEQRQQAELARRTADTLRYRALGRSLGSLSTTQTQSGNEEIGNLLAYASYLYTDRYKGDLYNSAVFQSLLTASQGLRTWSVHNGAVMAIDFVQNSDTELVSVSNYGEILRHRKQGDQLLTEVLLKDSRYDFRDVYVDAEGTVFTMSRNGEFLVLPRNGLQREFLINGVTHPTDISSIDDDLFIVVGERSIAYLSMNGFRQLGVRPFDAAIIATGRVNNHPLLFDDKGNMHEVVSLDRVDTRPVPVKGRVTAFANSKNQHLDAYGMHDGTIYVIGAGGDTRRLVGHRSRITRLKLNGARLYSSSYDGSMNLWMITGDKDSKIDPMPLFTANGWLMYFTQDVSKQHIWTGDQRGNITEALISIPMMAKRVEDRLHRDLTPDEWNYYIGRTVPFESFLQEKKGGKGR